MLINSGTTTFKLGGAQHLSERERTVLRAHYGLDGPEQSLREIGERIGLSGERVRQIEDRALGKLRAAANRHSDAGQ